MTVWACCFLPFWELKLHSGVRLLLAGSVPVTGKGLSHEAKYIQDMLVRMIRTAISCIVFLNAQPLFVFYIESPHGVPGNR